MNRRTQPQPFTAAAAAPALAALVALVSLFAPPRSDAHLGNISYADFEVRGSEVLLRLRYAAHVTPGYPEGQAPPTRAQMMALQGGIEKWIAGTTELQADGTSCGFEVDNIVGPDSNDDLELFVVWSCDAPIRGLRLNFHPLDARIADWQTIASLRIGDQTLSTVFTPGNTRWQVGEKTSRAEESKHDLADQGESALRRFFSLGVEHIWTGYDHLLFLFAVLLAGGGFARLAAIVTSFTVAHSITLGAAATGLIRLPAAPVEATIALSIVYVAVENLFDRGADRRALVTFCFGLVHGFGFASVLSQTALPASGILVPLLAFNLGVEAGQLAVVAAVMPLLAPALRSRHARRVRIALSVPIALAGAAWAVERIAAIVGS